MQPNDPMRALSGKTALFLGVTVVIAIIAFQAFGKHLELDDWVTKMVAFPFAYVIYYFWKRGKTDTDAENQYKPLIMHIEDNDVQRRVFAYGLKKMKLNFDLQSCDSGEKAIDMLTKSDFLVIKPDIIVLDLTLPGISGQEFLKQLRLNQELFHIKVIILSGHNRDDADQQEIVELCDFYVERGPNAMQIVKEAILACDPRLTHSPFEEVSNKCDDYQRMNHKLKDALRLMLDKVINMPSLMDRQRASIPLRELLQKTGEVSGRWNARLSSDSPLPPAKEPLKLEPQKIEPPETQN